MNKQFTPKLENFDYNLLKNIKKDLLVCDMLGFGGECVVDDCIMGYRKFCKIREKLVSLEMLTFINNITTEK